jgi:threonine/homoserine/homoserine lactone efflux protein
MDFLFLKGVFVGLIISVPPGPIGAICFDRTLIYGRLAGLLTAFGIAITDLFFAILILLSLNSISEFILNYQTYIHTLGAVFLFFIGYQFIKTKSLNTIKARQDLAEKIPVKNILYIFFSTIFLNLTNPVMFITFSILFSFLDLHAFAGTTDHLLILSLGIFLGAIGWWSLVVYFAERIKNHLKNVSLIIINKIIGLVLVVFSLIIITEWIITSLI